MDKKRSINREKITSATINRLLEHYNAFNIFELIQFAQNDGVRLPAETNAMTRKTVQHFIDKYNQEIKDAKRRVKVAIGNEKRRLTIEAKKINKSVVIDVKHERFDEDNEYAIFNVQMMEKCKKLIGVPHAYLQFTVQNPDQYAFMFGVADNYTDAQREIIGIKTDGIQVLISIQSKNKGDIWWKDIKEKYLMVAGSDSYDLLKLFDFRLVIMISDEVPSLRIQQSFRDGDKHCVLQPLHDLWFKYAENAESKASQKRCLQIAKQLYKLEEKYPNGVPEENMEEVALVAQRCIIMHDIIGNEITRYNSKSTKYFHFTNTRKNHVDENYITMDKVYESVSQQKLEEIINTATWSLIGGKSENPTSVRTIEGAYAVYNPEYDLFTEFSNSIGINNYKINAVANPDLNRFLKEGRIINSTPVALNELPNDMTNVKHADMVSAYTQHKNCKFYQGFLGKMHHFVQGNFDINFITKNVGMYQFMVIKNEYELLQKLGIFEGLIYTLPSPEILYMISKGIEVKILGGAFGSTFDFEYTHEMLQNRNYCTWAGKLGSDSDYNIYSFKGDAEWAGHLKAELGEDKVMFWRAKGLISIKHKKSSYTTGHHILAFTTSYTRINMLDLMESIEGELVKVILDGIYYKGDIDEDFTEIDYKDKEVKKHSYFGTGWYSPSEFDISILPEFDSRFDGNCVLAGAGGTGKSHSVFNYKGFTDVLYVVPTNELGQMSGHRYTTIHRLIGEECMSYRDKYRVPSVIFIDELTMMSASWIEKAISMYPECLMLIGGDIDNNKWYQCRNGYTGNFSEIWKPNGWRYVYYKNDYRSLDNELKQFKTEIRNEMDRIFTDGNLEDTLKIKQFIVDKIKWKLSMTEAMKLHKEGDIWITGTHKRRAMLKENGVSCEFKGKVEHGFTIHSFQGLTISDKKVFITMDMFEYAMYYTAISRVQNFSQLVFVC